MGLLVSMDSSWTHFGLIIDSLWTHYGIIMASWTHYGPIKGPIWNHYGLIMDSFVNYAIDFIAILRVKTRHFTTLEIGEIFSFFLKI